MTHDTTDIILVLGHYVTVDSEVPTAVALDLPREPRWSRGTVSRRASVCVLGNSESGELPTSRTLTANVPRPSAHSVSTRLAPSGLLRNDSCEPRRRDGAVHRHGALPAASARVQH